MLRHRLFLLLIVLSSLSIIGCGDTKTAAAPTETPKAERDLTGEWEGKDNNGLPTIITFGPGDAAEMDVANPDGNLVLKGAYELKGDGLTLTLTEGAMENMKPEKEILRSQMEEQLKSQLPQKPTMKLVWIDDDTIRLEPQGSPSTTLKRRK